MNKFKIPMIIFAAVFVVSAAALFFFIQDDIDKKTGEDVSPPAWVNENSSGEKHSVSNKVVNSGDKLNKKEAAVEEKTAPVEEKGPQVAKADEKAEQKTEEATSDSEGSTVEKTFADIRKTIVTDIFLDNLATYIADSYHPAGSMPHKPEKGYSSASFKEINTHFGLNLNGLMPEALALNTARKKIWAELLSPGSLTQVYRSDSKTLLNLIEEKGVLAERKFVEGQTFEVRELSTGQRADMFRKSAIPLRHASAVLSAIAENRDLLQAMDGYFKAEKRVDIANGIFQSDLNQSRNSNSVTARNKAAHSGKVLKDAITVREKIKTGITDKIKAFCSGPCENPNDSFYIAKWVYRRTKDNEKRIESILTGSELLQNLADQMEKRADQIENNL